MDIQNKTEAATMAQITERTDAPYDVNFCFPVCELEDDRVLLTPFLVRPPSPSTSPSP